MKREREDFKQVDAVAKDLARLPKINAVNSPALRLMSSHGADRAF